MSGTFSSTRRFYVTGASPGETVYFSTWAEEVAEKVAVLMGEETDLQTGEFIHIAVRAGGEEDLSQAGVEQGFADGRFRQKLIIADPASVDQEAVLSELCRLLLTRFVISRSRWSNAGDRVSSVPEWLVAGVAQQLYPELRLRSMRLARRAWEEAQGLVLQDVLSTEDLEAAGRKALAAAAVDWIGEEAVVERPWHRVLERLADGKPLTAEWLAVQVLGAASERELNKRWDLWFASRDLVETRWGSFAREDVELFERLLVVPSSILSIARGEVVDNDLFIADLVSHRGESWLPFVVTYLNLRISGAGIGKPEEFTSVCSLYQLYLQGLLEPEPSGRLDRWMNRGVANADLLDLLGEAESALRRLRDQTPQYP